MRQPPFDAKLIALRHKKIVGTNLKKNQGRTTVVSPQNVALEPPLLGFFPKTRHKKHNEKLGKVTDFGDPNFNAERASLDKFAVGWVGF